MRIKTWVPVVSMGPYDSERQAMEAAGFDDATIARVLVDGNRDLDGALNIPLRTAKGDLARIIVTDRPPPCNGAEDGYVVLMIKPDRIEKNSDGFLRCPHLGRSGRHSLGDFRYIGRSNSPKTTH